MSFCQILVLLKVYWQKCLNEFLLRGKEISEGILVNTIKCDLI